MADKEQVRNAGRRLATDLRDLREARKIKPKSIIEATRLTAEVFARFDESALVDHPAFNRVYIRSVVASYARVLEIDEELACRGLEEALVGTYAGGLRRIYIDGLSVDDWSASTESEGEELSNGLFGTSEQSELSREQEQDKAEDPSSRFGVVLRSRRLVLLTILVFAALAIVFLASRDSNQKLDDEEQSKIVRVPVSPPEPEWILLGDSIRYDVVATTEKLDPIRVKVDSDSLRPYWIEHLDTLSFFVRNNVIFMRELDVANILVEGHLVPDTMIDSNGRLEISRARAQTWLDSLAVKEAVRKRPIS